MAVSGRRRLALDGATGAAAVAWSKVRAKATGKPAPLTTTVMMHRFDSFVTWHDRPKSVDHRGPTTGMPPLPSIAIVLQGPVMQESDFTVETVRTYRAHYPLIPVYVSTWSSTAPEVVAALESAGATVLVSELPAQPGHHNINLQIVSSWAGVERARADGAEFLLKTRTDQRLYSPKAVPFLHAMLESFPIVDAGTQRARIVTLDYFTAKYIPYAVGDLITFGDADDIVDLWSAPLDARSADDIAQLPESTAREIAARRITESYLGRSFLDSTGWSPDDSLADWWRVLASRFVVVDSASLDLGWPRHTQREFRFRDYSGRSTFELVSFADWLPWAIDPTLAGVDVPEDRLDEPRWP